MIEIEKLLGKKGFIFTMKVFKKYGSEYNYTDKIPYSSFKRHFKHYNGNIQSFLNVREKMKELYLIFNVTIKDREYICLTHKGRYILDSHKLLIENLKKHPEQIKVF